MELDSLYRRVSDAIRRADVLDDIGDPGAPEAHREVSFLEEQIARNLPPVDPEGMIARRGAVRAAVAAGEIARAEQLVVYYGSEDAASDELRRELKRLLPGRSGTEPVVGSEASEVVDQETLVGKGRKRTERLRSSEFGRQLQRWRQESRLTQAQLAAALGYDMTYIVKVEGGARAPSRIFLAQLSRLPGFPGEVLAFASIRHAFGWPALPKAADRLIGRDIEINSLVTILTGPARCVTLIGPPGIGKTRLAMEVVGRLHEDFRGGAWWVPLLDIVDPNEVGEKLLRVLGLPHLRTEDPVKSIVDGMPSLSTLVVLDNFEHVIGARDVVARILANAPWVKVLVTSRESLEVTGEHVFTVPALNFPNPAAAPSFDTVSGSSAIQLFAARAAMARPAFSLTTSNSDLVLNVCARLEGIPLAIVLAAGALRTLDEADLAARLFHRLEIPVAVDMPRRHRSLQVAIEWSWDLLTTEEQELLAMLAVFSRGFTPEAVAEVAGISGHEAISLLTSLARKSLVEICDGAAGDPRFKLWAAIWAFAWDRLERSGRLLERRRDHLTYFLRFAEDFDRDLVGGGQIRGIRIFGEEFENARVAFDWSLHDDPTSAVALAASLWRFFLLRDIPMGRDWLDAALKVATDATPARAAALVGAGTLGRLTGHPDVAERSLSEAGELADQFELPALTALVLLELGVLAEQHGRGDDAEDLLAQALAVYERIGDLRGRALGLNGLAMVWRRRGQIERASRLWEEALTLFREGGDAANEAEVLGHQAWAAEADGRLDDAIAIRAECRRIQVALGDARGLAITTFAFGRIARKRGESDTAHGLLIDALRTFQAIGDLPSLASTLLELGSEWERKGSAARAVEFVVVAERLWEETWIAPQREEQDLLESVIQRCQPILGDAFDRAVATGRLLSIADASVLAGMTWKDAESLDRSGTVDDIEEWSSITDAPMSEVRAPQEFLSYQVPEGEGIDDRSGDIDEIWSEIVTLLALDDTWAGMVESSVEATQPADLPSVFVGNQVHGDLVLGAQSVSRPDVGVGAGRDPRRTKVLLLSANAEGATPLRISEELHEIDMAIREARYRDSFVLSHAGAVSVRDLQPRLLREQPQIVHFSGYGTGNPSLFLEDANGTFRSVPPAGLSDTFSLFSDTIRCVVSIAGLSDDEVIAISEWIGCIVCVSAPITDHNALLFVRKLYRGLADGLSVQRAFDIGSVEAGGMSVERGTLRLVTRSGIDPTRMTFVSSETERDRRRRAFSIAERYWPELRPQVARWLGAAFMQNDSVVDEVMLVLLQRVSDGQAFVPRLSDIPVGDPREKTLLFSNARFVAAELVEGALGERRRLKRGSPPDRGVR